MLKEIFTNVPKKEKNKQTKCNKADQVLDMQAVNFVLMKHNKIFLLWITIKDFLFNNNL